MSTFAQRYPFYMTRETARQLLAISRRRRRVHTIKRVDCARARGDEQRRALGLGGVFG
jgi:hypothetical protein